MVAAHLQLETDLCPGPWSLDSIDNLTLVSAFNPEGSDVLGKLIGADGIAERVVSGIPGVEQGRSKHFIEYSKIFYFQAKTDEHACIVCISVLARLHYD